MPLKKRKKIPRKHHSLGIYSNNGPEHILQKERALMQSKTKTGDILKLIREKLGLTQEDMALALGIHHDTYGLYERSVGDRRHTKHAGLILLAAQELYLEACGYNFWTIFTHWKTPGGHKRWAEKNLPLEAMREDMEQYEDKKEQMFVIKDYE